MDIANLSAFVSALVTVSASAERLVEIFKSLIDLVYPISKPSENEKSESIRKILVLLLSFLCCLITVLIIISILPDDNTVKKYLSEYIYRPPLASFFAMGGSSFWNGIQGYLNGLKNSLKSSNQATAAALKKQSEAEVERVEATKLRVEGAPAADIEARLSRAQQLDREAETLARISQGK